MKPFEQFFPGYFLKSNLTTAIILIFLSVYTILGNIMVCLVYMKDPGKRLRTISNYFVINLSIADILVGLGVEPLNASTNWISDQRILFSFYITAIVSCVCSIVTIAAMMIDRYIAVSRPFRYKLIVTKTRVRVSLVCMWCFSTHFALMPISGWQTEGFQVYLYGLGILTPTLFMLMSYYGLLKILKEKTRNMQSLTDSKEASFARKATEREKKISTTVFIMLVVFLVAWCPFVITDFILVFCPSCRGDEIRLARDVTLILGFFSSGVNPILYAWRVPNFRKGFLLLLKCRRNRNKISVFRQPSSQRENSFALSARNNPSILTSVHI